ncbi:hypothetical protein BC831DRAFT_509529 [Entophlyctis helioformis]|nr:hypothetical protein BC831DRAFT_509529 [Entophlyctis helioformis]
MNTDTLSRSTPSPTRARPFSFQSQQSPSRPSTPGVTQDTESFRGRRLSRSRVGLAHEQTDTMQGRSEYEASYCDKSPTRVRMASLGQVSPVRDLSDMQRVSWYPRSAGGEIMVPSDPNGRNPLNLGSPMPHSGHANGPSGSRGRRASDAPVSSRKAWQDAEDLQAESHGQARYDQKQQEQQQQQHQERQHRAAVLDRNVDHVQEAFNAGYVQADHEPRASQLQVAHDAAAQDARRPDVPQRSFAAWEATPVGGANRRLQQAGASTALGASFPSPLPWWDRPQPSQQTYRRGARRGPQQYGDSDDSAAVQDAICATEMSQSNVVIRSATSGAGDGSFVRSSVHVAAAQGGDVVGGAMATATAATKSGLYTVTASVATTADGGVTGTTAVVGDSLMASTSTSGGAGGAGGAMARQAGGRRAAGHSSGVRFSVNPITWDEQDAGGGARGGGSGGAYAAAASATTTARAQPRNVAMAAFELRGDQGGSDGGRGQRRGGQQGPDVEVDPITWQPTGRSRTPSPARFRS